MSAMQGILMSDEKVKHGSLFLNPRYDDYAYISTRQTALESSIGDFACSFWFVATNMGLYAQRLVGVHELSSSNLQWNVAMNSPGGTVSGQSAHLRFILYTTSANYMYVDSDAIFVRNRPTHVVVTWDGVNNAGMDMYLNGVKQTGSRAMVGTYSTAYSHFNLRFKIGRETTGGGPSAKGHFRDVAVWGKDLSDTEAAELYNNGKVKDVDTVSFYSDIVGYWPLKTNRNCLNNSAFHLDAVSGTIVNETTPFDVRSQRINFIKATRGNTRYVSFGSLIQISSTLAYWIGRSGTTHLANGKIVKIAINLTTGACSAPVDIITDGTYDLRGGSAALIDGKIFVFASRYNTGTATFIDLGYWESTDGTTGETYGSRVTLTTTMAGFNAYGEVTAGFSAGEYFVPMNESNSSTQYKIALYKTTDYGADQFATRVEVYDGSTKLTEPSLINLGSNTLMILARRNDSPYGLFRIVSTDGGATWDTPTLTNFGTGTGAMNAAMVLTDNEKVNVSFMDRGDGFIWTSRSNVIATILASATSFVTAARTANSYAADSLTVLGYSNILNLGNNKFLMAYSAESAAGVADLFVGIGELP